MKKLIQTQTLADLTPKKISPSSSIQASGADFHRQGNAEA